MYAKVCAKQLRETKDAYLLLFAFADNNFDITQLSDIYKEHITKFRWELWLPKSICKTLSQPNGFYAIDEKYFDKLEKKIDIKVTGNNTIKFCFSTYRKMFTNTILSDDARRKLNGYLQESLVEPYQRPASHSRSEDYYNRHPYDHWTNHII